MKHNNIFLLRKFCLKKESRKLQYILMLTFFKLKLIGFPNKFKASFKKHILVVKTYSSQKEKQLIVFHDENKYRCILCFNCMLETSNLLPKLSWSVTANIALAPNGNECVCPSDAIILLNDLSVIDATVRIYKRNHQKINNNFYKT